MTVRIVELTAVSEERPSARQRWSHLFVLIYALVTVFIILNLRDATLLATRRYVNVEAGISGSYPERWVIDTEGPYIFRVQDYAQQNYRTSIEVSTLPVNPETTTRNLVDNLIFNRSQTLSTFTVLSQEPITLENGVAATQLLYSFVASEQDPFLESFPTVVEGIDVLAIEGGQAITITFLSDRAVFDATYPIFEQFLNDLDF